MRYTGKKTTEISFPIGGIGTGSIGLGGDGRLVDWEIYNRPAKGSHNDYSHFAVKAEADGKGVQVKARRFNWRQRAVLALSCTAAVVTMGFVLKEVGDPQPFKDSATTVLSIVAQALMALAFMEQWALWIITNVISVAMWAICVVRGEAHAGVMVIMWVFYLLNSVNGMRVWLKLSKG